MPRLLLWRPLCFSCIIPPVSRGCIPCRRATVKVAAVIVSLYITGMTSDLKTEKKAQQAPDPARVMADRRAAQATIAATASPPTPVAVDVKAEKKTRQAADGAKAMAEYRAAQAAIHANTVRLRALRLAREAELAANPTKPKPKKTAKPKK